MSEPWLDELCEIFDGANEKAQDEIMFMLAETASDDGIAEGRSPSLDDLPILAGILFNTTSAVLSEFQGFIQQRRPWSGCRWTVAELS